MTYNEIRNVTGIYDDDELNAACECERKEVLAERIASNIVKVHGFSKGLYNGDVFSFERVRKILGSFGFAYKRANDERECHEFANKKSGDVICIFPTTYYHCQGNMRFENFHLF